MALICVCATISQASTTRLNVSGMGMQTEATKFSTVDTSYSTMSTKELEKEVERLTVRGNVPFEMGIELMKRWTSS